MTVANMKKKMVKEVNANAAAVKVVAAAAAAAKVNTSVAIANQAAAAVTATDASYLARMQEAYPKMVAKSLSKFTVEFKTEVTVGALVCLKVSLFIYSYWSSH